MLRSLSLILATASLLLAQAPAKKPITPEMLYTNKSFGGRSAPSITWLPDGKHWLQAKDGVLHKVEAITGKSEPAFDEKLFRKSLATVPGLDKQQVAALVRGSGLKANPERTGSLVDVKDGLYFAYFAGDKAVRLAGPDRDFTTFSPDGKTIAIVRGGNLFSVDVATQKETQITTDGGGDILNGKADWVYEEEIFNRNGQAYWWSPDSRSIAYLRFDDTPVKKFTIARPYPASGQNETYGYPKPGDPNPTVKLFAVKLGESPVELPIPGDPKDTLISRVGWTPANAVYAFVQNRVQTWLDFTVWQQGKPKVLFRDLTQAWIDDPGEPNYLKDGSFLFLSQRTGEKQIYHYSADGKCMRQVSEYPVISIVRCLPDSNSVFYITSKGSTNGANLASSHISHQASTLLTDTAGTHGISMAPSGELYVDRHSTPDALPVTVLKKGNAIVRELDASTAPAKLDGYTFGKYQRIQIPLADKETLEAAITYPPDFNANKKYPVWMLTYAGPQTPTIKDAWSPRMFEQVLANLGIVELRVDPRAANGHGAKYSWPTWKRLGVEELKDLEAAADWIGAKPWCDKSRIGISGHSYGGYITAYALTHSKKWSAGIAGAPVTDWRLYDSIYTERYMGLPSENRKGYDESSCIKAAKNLHGKLLIIHGLIDDNVHFQNAMQFADALQKANKQFELMVYPNARHPIHGRHYLETQIEFIKKTMLK